VANQRLTSEGSRASIGEEAERNSEKFGHLRMFFAKRVSIFKIVLSASLTFDSLIF
jgi:hypothetical protein